MEGGSKTRRGNLRLGMAEKFSSGYNKFGVPGASGVEISGRKATVYSGLGSGELVGVSEILQALGEEAESHFLPPLAASCSPCYLAIATLGLEHLGKGQAWLTEGQCG